MFDASSCSFSSSSCSSSSSVSSSSLSQVYVVAVHRSGQRQRPDCTTDLSVSSPPANHSPGCESGGAGLLKLVQSDLSTLSQLWLSALQDYGLLSLPQEYASQLPETGRRRRGGGEEAKPFCDGGCWFEST